MKTPRYPEPQDSAKKSQSSVRETGEGFDVPRKKFATQMDAELLAQLRRYAKSEGRQIQAVLEDAVRAHLDDKQGYQMRADVREAMEQSLGQFDELYQRLAQ
ncbi:hypothetical protein [Fretibacter rubidus]|uniref:hypothetical protein n=1 Tax=Fretibacter rubidus TaxID=570162 RepID=UPI00352AA6D0